MKDESSFRTTLNIAWQYEPEEEMYYILDLRHDEWSILSDSAAVLWKSVVSFSNVSEMIKTLIDEYKIDEKTARADIDTFLADMIKRGYIEEGVYNFNLS